MADSKVPKKKKAKKGIYMKKVTVSSTMGPGLKVDYEKI